MTNHHNNTLIKEKIDLTDYFNKPASERQKQYEAVRAIVIDKEQTETVAKKFGYKSKTVYSLVRDAKAGKLNLFPFVQKGPKQKRTLPETQDKVIQLRAGSLIEGG